MSNKPEKRSQWTCPVCGGVSIWPRSAGDPPLSECCIKGGPKGAVAGNGDDWWVEGRSFPEYDPEKPAYQDDEDMVR